MMAPIGIFDSGYGGLTILEKIRAHLPQYDYIYLGDNARAPYGTRSYEVVYHYTRQCVEHLFEMGCRLVILACNTASAKALRTIQQRDLPQLAPDRRVLGVIRPTVEAVGQVSVTRHVGILATPGTVLSASYPIEISKLHADIKVSQQACPMWVPLIENDEHQSQGADYFVEKYTQMLLRQDADIDSIVLACTHYPLLLEKIAKVVPPHIRLITQGQIVAERLADYLMRHPEIDQCCQRGGRCQYYTTESTDKFSRSARIFLQEDIVAEHVELV
ncbi:MAG: glutamate racemase [Paludibacteraceae bacterium]|nr:glutamate racemase [Paludibacteraceae bacterium]